MVRHASFIRLSAAFGLLLVVAATVMAADPNGTWTWKRPAGRGGRGGGGGGGGAEAEISLVLKAEGEKLTGTLTQPPGGRGGGTDPVKLEIKNGTFKNDEVAFETEQTIDFMGQSITNKSKYSGKVEGDKIKGKIEREGGRGGGGGGRGGDRGGRGGGGPQDWEATRKK